MKVYQFKMWNKRFAVDVESGNFFEIDKITADALNYLDYYSLKETKEKLSVKYGYKSAKKIINDLADLKRQGVLFTTKKESTTDIEHKITDLTLNIINACNLKCRYCWNQRGSYGAISDSNKKMDYSVASKAIDILLKESRGRKSLVIDFYGGEPLLNYELIKKVIEYCKVIQKNKNVTFRFLLATNGTLLTKDRVDFLIRNDVDIALSLDGPKDVQDTQRPFDNGSGTFEAIMANINSLSDEQRKRIVARVTFTPYFTKIIKTFSFLRKLGFESIELCESEKAGYGLESSDKFFFDSNKNIRHLKRLYYDLAIFYTKEVLMGNLTYKNTYFNRFFKQLSRLYNIQTVVGVCSAAVSLISVDVDGNLYPCTAFIGIPQFKIGDVKSGINKEKLRDFSRIKVYTNKKCEKCWAKRICQGCGSCCNLNYFSNANSGEPDPYYCNLFLYKTKLMITMIAEIRNKNSFLLDRLFIPKYYTTRGRRKLS